MRDLCAPWRKEGNLCVTTPAWRPSSKRQCTQKILMSLETGVALIARAAHGQPSGICVCRQCREAVAAHVHAARAAGCAAELGAVLCSGRLPVQHVPLSTGCVVRRLPADVQRVRQGALPSLVLCCGLQCQVATTEAAPRTVLRCVPARPPEHEEQSRVQHVHHWAMCQQQTTTAAGCDAIHHASQPAQLGQH